MPRTRTRSIGVKLYIVAFKVGFSLECHTNVTITRCSNVNSFNRLQRDSHVPLRAEFLIYPWITIVVAAFCPRLMLQLECLSIGVSVFSQRFLRVQAGVWGVHAGLVPAVPRHPYWTRRLSSYTPLSVSGLSFCLAASGFISSSNKAAWKLPRISCDLTEELEGLSVHGLVFGSSGDTGPF